MARKLDEDKRERILDAAREAFGTDGFQKTTIKQIALRTDIAQGTVYTYFASKEVLFDEVVAAIWSSFAEGFNEIKLREGTLTEKFMEFLEFGFDLITAIHPLLRGMYTEANRRELIQDKVDVICADIDEMFTEGGAEPQLFGELSSISRRFNLNMMVSGVLLRTSMTKPEKLSAEIAHLKKGILRSLAERVAQRGLG